MVILENKRRSRKIPWSFLGDYCLSEIILWVFTIRWPLLRAKWYTKDNFYWCWSSVQFKFYGCSSWFFLLCSRNFAQVAQNSFFRVPTGLDFRVLEMNSSNQFLVQCLGLPMKIALNAFLCYCHEIGQVDKSTAFLGLLSVDSWNS